VRDGRPLPKEVPARQHYEERYDKLLFDTKRERLPQGVDASHPPLLQAKHCVVPFIDIQGLLPKLIERSAAHGHRRPQQAGKSSSG
jgi:hypothetical protein